MAGLILSTTLSQEQPYFDNLLKWRGQFETVLKSTSQDIGYTTIFSETLGGAHGDALYPAGSAYERYILYFKEGSSGGNLIYERRHGKSASVDWYVPFVETTKKGPVSGTVRKFLQACGFTISPGARLTPVIRRQLSASGYFASYSYHPMMGGFANLIKPNGTAGTTTKSDQPIVITPEEKRLLRHLGYPKDNRG